MKKTKKSKKMKEDTTNKDAVDKVKKENKVDEWKKKDINLSKPFFVVCILIFIISAYFGVRWYLDQSSINNEITEIEDMVEVEELDDEDLEEVEIVNQPENPRNDYWDFIRLPFINVDFNELLAINRDTVAFVNVSGTNINYPVVQTSNNSYYLNHSFRKRRNKAGWVFMDYRNNARSLDRNTILYGHSRAGGIMFGDLRTILQTRWVRNSNNHVVRLSTPTENTVWRVFSVYTIPKVDNLYMTINFPNDSEYNRWLQMMINQSDFNFNTTVNSNDRVLTLSTCHRDNNYRVVMHAKLIKRAPR